MEDLLNNLLEELVTWAPKLASVVLILVVFYALSKLIKCVIRKTCNRLNVDDSLSALFAKASSVTLIIVGLITALGTVGINVTALVAGLGLTGFALGFALKDIVSNLLSGILILLYRPFKVGDTIKVAAFEGEVIAIDLRYTELLSSGNKILMPNSKLFTDPIIVMVKNDSDSDTKTYKVPARQFRQPK